MPALFPFRKKKYKKPLDAAHPPTAQSTTPLVMLGNHSVPTSEAAAHEPEDPSFQSTTDSASKQTSLNAKAILNAFKYSLEILGEAPLPGIGSATTALLRVMNSLQDVSQVGKGWQQLAERLERLSFLIRKVDECPTTQASAENICGPLNEALKKLAADINEASNQGKLSGFFNSTDTLSAIREHNKILDSLIGDLTLAIIVESSESKTTLKDSFEGELSRIQEVSTTGGMNVDIARNIFGKVAETAEICSGNVTHGGAKIHFRAHDNIFGDVTGSFMSGNVVGLSRGSQREGE